MSIHEAVFQLKKVFGFTKSGTSLAGRFVRKLLGKRELRKLVGVSLVAVVTASFLVHSFANIGGPVVLAANLNGGAPKTVIDASTTHSVQSPINFEYESRGFSWYHSGADLVAPTGTPIYPIMAGVVEAVNYDPFGFGRHVIVKHDEGYESIYGHMSQPEVKVGEKVGLNTKLGLSGSTGFSTGPHLHIEIHLNGVPVDPADIVPGVK